MLTEPETQDSLPLTESTFFILLSLAPAPKHGYAILKDVQFLSHNRIVLSTGTLYGALKRLLEQGWIERVEESDLDKTGRPRKAYSLTTLGRRIFNAEVSRLEALLNAASLRGVQEQGR